METAPEFPLEATPLLKEINPLDPETPASDVAMATFPELARED